MDPQNPEPLLRLAAKYVWWKTPEDAIRHPDAIIAKVMDLGDYDDVQALAREAGEDRLRQVLQRAEAGQFSEKSWAYWHYRLRLSDPGTVPALPRRRTV
jgi:hypothetical protein